MLLSQHLAQSRRQRHIVMITSRRIKLVIVMSPTPAQLLPRPLANPAMEVSQRRSKRMRIFSCFMVFSIQTVSVGNSCSSFSFSLQQLAKAETRQNMVKAMKRHERAVSHPVQPSPKQKYRKTALASAVERKNERRKRVRKCSIV